jgi:hypothetical protein
VFALLGIGGAGLLVKFEPYRPYFIVVTFALLGTGFYLTYRKPKAAAAGDQKCVKPSMSKLVGRAVGSRSTLGAVPEGRRNVIRWVFSGCRVNP